MSRHWSTAHLFSGGENATRRLTLNFWRSSCMVSGRVMHHYVSAYSWSLPLSLSLSLSLSLLPPLYCPLITTSVIETSLCSEAYRQHYLLSSSSSSPFHRHLLGLPVQHRLAEEAYIFCCCTFFIFLPFELIDENQPVSRPPVLQNGRRRWRCSQIIHRHSTHDAPPFYREAKCTSGGSQNCHPNRLRTAVFFNGGTLWENKNKLVKDRWQVYHHTKLGVWELLVHWVPKKVKVENFLYILYSNSPRPAGARQYYTNSQAPGCAHKICTDIRPMLPPFYKGGKVSQILAQITTKIVFGLPCFWTAALYRKSKTNLARTDDRPITTPNMR